MWFVLTLTHIYDKNYIYNAVAISVTFFFLCMKPEILNLESFGDSPVDPTRKVLFPLYKRTIKY